MEYGSMLFVMLTRLMRRRWPERFVRLFIRNMNICCKMRRLISFTLPHLWHDPAFFINQVIPATFADKVLADTIITQKLSDSVVRPEEINPTERTVVSDEDWTNAVIKAPANTPFNRAVHNKIHFP